MAWLASLPSSLDGEEEEAIVGDACDAPAATLQGTAQESESTDTGALEWLTADMGFEASVARNALLKVGGDADEALQLLLSTSAQDSADDGHGIRPTKRLRRHSADEDEDDDTLDVEGFQCRLRGRALVLTLPNLPGRPDGPAVGRARAGGGIVFSGVDEWIQELYEASPARSAECTGSTSDSATSSTFLGSFDASAAVGAISSGAPWVWRNFATPAEIESAHAELESLLSDGSLLAGAAATTARTKARDDRIAFLDIAGQPRAAERCCPASCLTLFRRLEAAAAALTWPLCADGKGTTPLLCPRLGMAAVYDGGGAGYAPHRDNEWLESKGKWLNFRRLTAIAYVNPSGFDAPEDGGQLRCYVGAAANDQTGTTASRVEEVAPRGGTAVLFPARSLLHEVRPSHARRYALTLWLMSPGDAGKS